MNTLDNMERELREKYERLRRNEIRNKEERLNYKLDMRRCDLIDNFDKRISCKSALLNEVTKIQDTVNLDIMADFRRTDPQCSKDPRWQPVHIVDNANAVILGISKAEFKPDVFWHAGSYVKEKSDTLCTRFRFNLPSI